MAEFNIQADAIDVTQIMEQIRRRIREKRGVDYTEQQIRELATVKLERFLDPRQVRSDLVEHYRQLEPPGWLDPIQQTAPVSAPEAIEFDKDTIYVSSRGPMGKLIRLIRKLLNPILRLFFNPDPIIFAMARQAEINTWTLQLLQRQTDLVERVNAQFERVGKKFAAREELDALNYEVLNNLVVEMTRLAVDMKNHKMRVESVAGRLDFDERRARAVESVLQNRSTPPTGDAETTEDDPSATSPARTRRRRRRSRRRSGSAGAGGAGETVSETPAASEPSPGTRSTSGAEPTAASEPAAAEAERTADPAAPVVTPATTPAPSGEPRERPPTSDPRPDDQ